MKKEHSVFIILDSWEILKILHPYLRRKGLLKDIPKDVEPESSIDIERISIEYNWDEEIKD